jgi:peptidoglycan/xylan/chitin deacetylase (PgdA/CDA1 family)
MINNKKLFLIGLCLFTVSASHAMEVAITVDDVPANGVLPHNTTRLEIAEKMLTVFKKHHIKGVYGLINGVNTQPANSDAVILQRWIDEGQLLGNHTYHHLDLAKTPAAAYIDDIRKNEPILRQYMGDHNYKYFRYPYLSEGNTQQRRDAVRKYLFDNHYKIAPVTVDFFEYEWSDPYARCIARHDEKAIAWLKETYLEQSLNALTIAHALSMMLYQRDIKYVLLIHINAMTTDMLDAMLTAYENQGVKFITLPEALKDDAYEFNPNIVRDRAYTFLNQVRLARKLDNPEIVEKLYATLPEDRLETVCK